MTPRYDRRKTGGKTGRQKTPEQASNVPESSIERYYVVFTVEVGMSISLG